MYWDVPSPNEDIDNSMVRDVFYEGLDLDRIINYCEQDVITLSRVFLQP